MKDLEKVKLILKEQLHFTIKEGKSHEGIKNCFIKFQDGNYLEFINPIDSLPTIGKYYNDFLKTRQGGTSLAISIANTELVKKMLNGKNIKFTADSNKIWQTIEPENSELFFIEYADKNWKENQTNTTHSNTANALMTTYILTDNIETEVKKYKALGFTEMESGLYLETPYKLIKIGRSRLYLLDGTKSKKINQQLNTKKLEGIFGFEIKVGSLKTFNSLTNKKGNIKYKNDRTTIYFKEYNLFLTFTE